MAEYRAYFIGRDGHIAETSLRTVQWWAVYARGNCCVTPCARINRNTFLGHCLMACCRSWRVVSGDERQGPKDLPQMLSIPPQPGYGMLPMIAAYDIRCGAAA